MIISAQIDLCSGTLVDYYLIIHQAVIFANRLGDEDGTDDEKIVFKGKRNGGD